MGFYYFDYRSFIIMLPAVLISMYAQFKVNSTFQKYSRVNTVRRMTGADAAYRVMQYGGAQGVQIQHISGNLNDNFNPTTGIISLSDPVYDATSVSAVGVAAHEAGHAVQHAHGYLPNKIRAGLVPVTQIGSTLAMPMIVIGLILPVQYDFIVNLGILLYSLCVLFQLVTLPVEFNASARALKALDETGILYPEELDGAKKVLQAAAMTYVAATFASLLSLLRLLLIAGNRRRDLWRMREQPRWRLCYMWMKTRVFLIWCWIKPLRNLLWSRATRPLRPLFFTACWNAV